MVVHLNLRLRHLTPFLGSPPPCVPSDGTASVECHCSACFAAYQVHQYISTGLANSKFGIRNSHLQARPHLASDECFLSSQAS